MTSAGQRLTFTFSSSTESATKFLKVLNCSVGTNDFDDVPLNGQLFKPIFEKCFQGHLKRMLEFKYKGLVFKAYIIVDNCTFYNCSFVVVEKPCKC